MTPEIITRPAAPYDAQAVTDLLIERKYDATPFQDDHNQERIVWWQEHGEDHNTQEIQRSLDEPDRNLFRVAAIGSTVVGFMKAFSYMDDAPIPGGPFTYAQGLMVGKSYEARGVGGALAQDFCRWAVPLGQDVCIEVTVGNQHARTIYENHGCQFVTSLPPTNYAPPRDVLVLPYQQLAQLAGH